MMTLSFKRTALMLALLAGVGLASGSALADKGGKGKGQDDHYSEKYDDHGRDGRGGHDGSDDHDDRHDDDKVWIRIGDDDRLVIQKYLGDDHRRACPPGLAKKHNGCLPPGLAKKYKVGEPLPRDLRWEPVSDDLARLLKTPPSGYQYVQVDKDILLIGEATKKVIDAVTLISAVGE